MKRKGVWISASVAAMIASAICFLVYVANGIVYGDLVGLKSREHDLQVEAMRASVALAFAAGLQLVAIIAISSSLPRRIKPSDTVERWVIRLWHLAIAIVVSGLGTALIYGLILKLGRVFHW